MQHLKGLPNKALPENEPTSFTRALPRSGPEESARLDEAVKASSGTIPVIIPNDSGAVSEKKTKKQIDCIVSYICTSVFYHANYKAQQEKNFNDC